MKWDKIRNWKLLGRFRKSESLHKEEEKLAAQELLDTEEDVQAELSYMDVWNDSSKIEDEF